MNSKEAGKNSRVHKNIIRLVGISARTTNQDEMSGKGKIAGLWEQFYRSDILSLIPAKKTPGQIVVAYTDFETDEKGPYTIIIGAEVHDTQQAPENMAIELIPASFYRHVSTSWGSIQSIGIEAWKKIWEDEALKSERTYRADLEVYGEDAKNRENARFDIFLGVE